MTSDVQLCGLVRSEAVRRALASLAVLLAALTSGCGDLQRQGQASSYLIIESLQAAPGNDPTQFKSNLISDVVTVVDGSTTYYNDLGQVTFRLGLKDPGSSNSPTKPTSANYITVNRYHVRYLRADGRNTPGVDVPYSFDGAFTVTVAEGSAESGFTIVRNMAKVEAPLAALRHNGIILSTIAEVTFYGHDQTGREVSASARISIEFANFLEDD